MPVDESVERLGRWTARRSSRRGFLGSLGKVGVMVAGGSTMAALLSDVADARVCGQSGVSPLCPDFDCNETMGWCWYAVGCCAGGQLKKICDCCAPVNNVHGYCPAGTNVLCVFESCGADPRVHTTPVVRLASDNALMVERLVREARFPHGSSTVVLCEAGDVAARALAVTVGEGLRAPVLQQGPGALSAANRNLIRSLGSVTAKIVGSGIATSVDGALAAEGVTAERIGAASEVDVLSAEVAQWLLARAPQAKVVAIAQDAPSWAVALGAAFAASQRTALVRGAHGVLATERAVWAVGPGASALSSLITGSSTIGGSTPQALASALAAAAPAPLQQFTMAPTRNPTLLELAALGLPIVLHSSGSLALTADVLARRSATAPGRVYLAGLAGTLRSPEYRRLQSDLNGFDIHLLTGVAGQGLPVISQPLAERPAGLARPGDSSPPPAAPPPSWLGWGA